MTATTRSDEAASVVLMTGAAGRIATMLRPRMARPGRLLRLLDLRPLVPSTGEEADRADLTDPAAVDAAARGARAIVHLGGRAKEAPWADVLAANVEGTRNVLEAARRQGVERVVLASSFHAVGWLGWEPGTELPAATPARPDSYYGWSKAAVESLGRLYADRFGIRVFCVRIGTCNPAPRNARQLATWLSPDDAARLVEACLATDKPGYHMLWGASANRRRWWSLAEGEAIGYRPRDDAERYAAGVPASLEPGRRLGAAFSEVDLGTLM